MQALLTGIITRRTKGVKQGNFVLSSARNYTIFPVVSSLIRESPASGCFWHIR